MEHHTIAWDWTGFFERYEHAVRITNLSVDTICQDLSRLSFEQGLQMILASAPHFDHDEWRRFCQQMSEQCHVHPHAETWLIIGDFIRSELDNIQHILSYDIEQAVSVAQRQLATRQNLEQFAWMACLQHHAQTSIQARMMFDYLLPKVDPDAQRIQDVRVFYDNLAQRQRAVAALAARGYTNHEIASVLCIEPSSVADHLTDIYSKLEVVLQAELDVHARRYRLIHWLTRLFERCSHLLTESSH